MLTVEMQRAAIEVADKYRTPVRGVLALASAMGSGAWRGCIPVTEYKPRPNRWKTPVEYESLI